MISAKLDQAANLMIRPLRRPYQIDDLGPSILKSEYGLCKRTDFQVTFNYPSHTTKETNQFPTTNENISASIPSHSATSSSTSCLIEASIFTHLKSSFSSSCETNSPIESPCVIAMHGNTGSRMSTLSLLEPVLKYNMSFVIFDFVGCGNSEGEHVTLGYYEKLQIHTVMEHVMHEYGYHKFILYGRSMGAASALFYAESVYKNYVHQREERVQEHINLENKEKKEISKEKYFDYIHKLNTGYFGYEVTGLILDSPYYETRQMFLDLASNRLWFIPQFIISYILGNLNNRIIEKLSYMGTLEPENKSFSILDNIKIPKETEIPFPIFVIYGLNDDVVGKDHTWELFKRLVCLNKKLHVLQDQGHGGHRDDSVKMGALEWILECENDRVKKRIERDAELIGVSVNEFVKYFNRSKEEEKIILESVNTEKDKMEELTSDRSYPMQGYFKFDSNTSLYSHDARPISHQIVEFQEEQEDRIDLMKIKEKKEEKDLKNERNENAFEKDVFGRMSRIAPYKIMRMKMGITSIGNEGSKNKQA